MKTILCILGAATLSFSAGAALAEMQPIPNPPERGHTMHGHHHWRAWHHHHHHRHVLHEHH